MKLLALLSLLIASVAFAIPVAEEFERIPGTAAAGRIAGTVATVRIMAFGASIVGAPGCWRALLWQQLQEARITNTDFVGSRGAPDCGFPYDGENEGHSGSWATKYVSEGRLPPWLNAAKPDVILMHLGTNDVLGGKSTSDIIKAYGTLVDQMRESKSSMKIIISQLLPLDPKRYGEAGLKGIIDLNTAIRDFGRTKTTANSKIWIVDNFSGFNVTTDTNDGEHPNAAGDQKIAKVFFPATVEAIRSVS